MPDAILPDRTAATPAVPFELAADRAALSPAATGAILAAAAAASPAVPFQLSADKAVLSPAAEAGEVAAVIAPTRATLTIGAGNSAITYMARFFGAAGNALTVAQVARSAAPPAVAMTGTDLTLLFQPATRQVACPKIGVSGTPPRDYFKSSAVDNYDTAPVTTVVTTEGSTDHWYIYSGDHMSNPSYRASVASTALSPIGLTGWTVDVGTGQPVIAAGIGDDLVVTVPGLCTAADAAAAVNLAVLDITAAAGGNGLGAIAAQTLTHLAGGLPAASNPPQGIFP